MTSSASPKIEMGWLHPVDGDRTFVLQAESKAVGRIRFEDECGARSAAEWNGRRWTFECTGAFRHCIVIRAEGSDTPVAEFTRFLAGGGVASFANGSQYNWVRTHLWSGRWCFRSRQQKSAVCVSQQAGALMQGGRVAVCAGALEREETHVLVLLAWYLRILETVELAESPLVCA